MNETTINNKSIDTSINRKSVFVKRPENNNDICFQIKNIVFPIKTDNYTKLEKDFHNLFNNKRIVGEWFNFSITELKEIFPDISKDFDYAASPYLEEKRFREVYA